MNAWTAASACRPADCHRAGYQVCPAAVRPAPGLRRAGVHAAGLRV